MLDREDFKVLSITLEDIAFPERSIESPSTDNNTTSLAFLASVLVDLEFTCLL